MRFVGDTSVVLKLAVAEEGHDDALTLVLSAHELLIPDFVLVEVGSALWKKVIRKEIQSTQAIAAARELRASFPELLETMKFAERALAMALELQHPIYDCIYLAAAEDNAARVVTADLRLLQKVAESRFAELAVPLRLATQ